MSRKRFSLLSVVLVLAACLTVVALTSGKDGTRVADGHGTRPRSANRAPVSEPLAGRSDVVDRDVSARRHPDKDREPAANYGPGGRELLEETSAARSGVCGTVATLQLYAKHARRGLKGHHRWHRSRHLACRYPTGRPGLQHLARAASAPAVGSQVGTLNFSQDCQAQANGPGLGVGITYDGRYLWYSCYQSSPDLVRADPFSGQVLASYDISGGLGALAYDATRNAIWAAPGSSTHAGDVRLIQLDGAHNVTGSQVAFNTRVGPLSDLVDGLAYDASDDSLYYSPDTSTTIYHLSTSGQQLGSFFWAGTSCYNSGLAIGGGLLYEGADGCNHVWAVYQSDPSLAYTDFSTGDNRDEGLTCDPDTFSSQGLDVIWSKEAYSPMRAHAYVIPSGTCGVGGQTASRVLTPPDMAGGSNPSAPQVPNCHHGDPVSCASGNFYENVGDIGIPGRGRALSAARTYNAELASSDDDRLGYGWTHSYGTHLTFNSDASEVTVHHGNGSFVVFDKQADGTYTAAAWVRSKLAASGQTLVLTYHDQTQDVFDASSGQLLKERDRNGYETTLAYANGRLQTVTDPGGRTLSYSYNAAGRVSGIQDSAGRSVTFAYDGAGNLTDATDARGKTTHYAYDAQHELTTITMPGGGVTTNVYDSQGRVTKQTDAEGDVTSFAYGQDADGNATTTITSPRGYQTVETFHNLEPTSITRGAGTSAESTTTMTYDSKLDLRRRTDGAGHTTTYSYDSDGNITSVTDPLGHQTTATYTQRNDPATVTDARGITTTYHYDANGNLTEVSRPLTSTGESATETFSYDDSAHPGDVTAKTDADGHSWRYAYDPAGNLVAQTDPEGDKQTTSFDSAGRPTDIVSPRGNASGANPADFTTHLEYDAAGDLTRSVDPLGHATVYSYDADRNRISVRDPRQNLTTTAYDHLGRPTTVTRADNSALTTAYDRDGNVASRSDGLNQATTYTYDALDRLKQETDPLAKSRLYSYDDANRLVAVQDESAQTASYGYDAAGELTSVAYSDGQTAGATFAYNADGQRTSMTDASGSSSFSYDSLGRLTQESDGHGHTFSYGYDLAGHLTSERYPPSLVQSTAGSTPVLNNGSVLREYDRAGRMTKVTDWFGNVNQFGYGADGEQTSASYANGTNATLSYDRSDALSKIVDATTAGLPFLTLPYGRNADGQITAANALGAADATDQAFSYDANGRLTSSSVGQDAVATVPTTGYSFDAGDRLTKITSSSAVDRKLGYNAGDELTRASVAATDTTLQTFTYDSLGERLSATNAATGVRSTYGWNQARRLTSYGGPVSNIIQGQTGGTTVQTTYGYSADGLLTAVGVAGQAALNPAWSHAEGGLPTMLSDGASLYVTGPDGLPLEQITQAGTVRWYHHDAIGSTRALTSASGHVTASYAYDPYGNAITTTAITQPFLFAGQYTDFQSGLIYMRQRWYDPKTAQFLSRDPLGLAGGDQNPYGYAGRDPVNSADPSGLCTWDFLSGSFWTDGNCLSDHAGDVSLGAAAVARVAAAVGAEPVAAAATALAVTAGAAAVGSDIEEHKYALAVVDALSASIGGAAGGLRVAGDLFELSARTAMARGAAWAPYFLASHRAKGFAEELVNMADTLAAMGFSYNYLATLQDAVDPEHATKAIRDPISVPQYPDHDPAPSVHWNEPC